MEKRFRVWALALVFVVTGAVVLNSGTENVQAASSSSPLDLGMSVLAVNITSISIVQNLDLFGPYYLLNWQISDPIDNRVQPQSGSFGDGSGCGPCSGNSFAYAFPANETVLMTLTLWDNQGVLGMQPVNIAGASNSWLVAFSGSRYGEQTQVPYGNTGSSCGGSCRAASVTFNATVQGGLHYQTNNRYFWYKSWSTLAAYLNQNLASYCISQLTFTPQQQKALLAALIWAGFFFAFAGPTTILGSMTEQDLLVEFINHGEMEAFHSVLKLIYGYTNNSFQVAQKSPSFPADATSCGTWAAWSLYGLGMGNTVYINMNTLDADLLKVNADTMANNVPQLISHLTTVGADIGTAEGTVRNMMNTMNASCSSCSAGVQTSVLIPMLAYLQSDAIYHSGLVSAVQAGARSLTINGVAATSLVGGGIGLPYGLVNKAYDAGLVMSAGMPPQAYAWSGFAGTAPAGTGFGNGCAAYDFCGTPPLGSAGSYSFKATLTDGAGDTFTIPFTWNVYNWHTLTVSSSATRLGYWKHTSCYRWNGILKCVTYNYNYGSTATVSSAYTYDATTPVVTIAFATTAGSVSPTSCLTSGGSCSVTLTDSTAGTATITATTQGYSATVQVTYCTSSSPCPY